MNSGFDCRYFDFYPAPKSERTSPETHGVIPVWGFATVVETTHPSIGKGERVFGYFGMSRYVLVPLETTVNKYSCYIPRPHLPAGLSPTLHSFGELTPLGIRSQTI